MGNKTIIESPFKAELRRRINDMIDECRNEGTVAMSTECLMQCVMSPHHCEGAPRGTNARYYYREMFREMIANTPKFRKFTYDA